VKHQNHRYLHSTASVAILGSWIIGSLECCNPDEYAEHVTDMHRHIADLRKATANA
jgi:hypothetical protein